jgi:hypothetical protein
MFQPPFTAEDPELRKQQIIVLVCILSLSFYRLIIYNIGACPGLIVGSWDPETLKSTTVEVGLRMSGDPSHFLECGSSKVILVIFVILLCYRYHHHRRRLSSDSLDPPSAPSMMTQKEVVT